MSKNIRAVALDLDGTLLNGDHKLSSYSIAVLDQLNAAGILVIVATGRSLGVLGLAGDFPRHIHFVGINGAQILKLAEPEQVQEVFIPERISRAITEGFTAQKYHLHAYYHANRVIYQHLDKKLLANNAPQFLKLDFEELIYKNIDLSKVYKFVTVGTEDALAQILAPLQAEFGSELYAGFSMPGVMEIMGTNTDKQKGVARVLRSHNLGLDNLLAIGDGFNDLALLESAAVPVIMSNAFAVLRSKGYYLAPANTYDGAAEFLAAWFRLKS